MATLVREDGLQLKTTPRSLVFDILIAYSCREAGAILVSAITRDLDRIARIFAFQSRISGRSSPRPALAPTSRYFPLPASRSRSSSRQLGTTTSG